MTKMVWPMPSIGMHSEVEVVTCKFRHDIDLIFFFPQKLEEGGLGGACFCNTKTLHSYTFYICIPVHAG